MGYVTEATLTDVVAENWSNISDPRLRQIMQAVVKHVHALIREVEPTLEEYKLAVDFLIRSGKMSSDKRSETGLIGDVLGLSMLVDAINNRRPGRATPSTIEGPFHVAEPPPDMANGSNMAASAPGILCFVSGKVTGLSGEPIAGAAIEVWQTDGDGLYEDQRGGIEGPWMRAMYYSEADGSYAFRTVVPIAYTIPMDGPVGELMNRTNMEHMRPAHMHFALAAPDYHDLVTHIFEAGDRYIDIDVVYAVKEPLITEFTKMPAGSKAPNGEIMNEPFTVVHYDFVLEKKVAQAAAA
jgi:hydroxyquinol 1,2-dioxygenase